MSMTFRQLRALFTYWCHVCWLRFRGDNLVVDGGQMVSLVSVHIYIYSLLPFSLVPVVLKGQYFSDLHGH